MMTENYSLYSRLIDEDFALVDQLHKTSEGDDANAIRERIRSVRNRMAAVFHNIHSAATSSVNASPVQIIKRDGYYYLLQADGNGNMRSVPVGPHHPDYATVGKEYDRLASVDIRAVEAAFAEWGWRGAVSIRHYGDKIVVTDGSRKAIIDAASI